METLRETEPSSTPSPHLEKPPPTSKHLRGRRDTRTPEVETEDGSGSGSSEEEKVEEENASDDRVVKPLTAEALAEFEAAQARTGVVYISRIPPAMRPSKVRHLMSAHGQVGRVYLQQEDPKRAHLRRKYTSTKKAHYTEGWVEFLDKRVGRAVAEMLNGHPIGGKKGTRWHDDIWTMKYLPRFKWNMLTEQVAHEAASHTARLRVELTQSKAEQRDYLKNVELARVLGKREERKRKHDETGVASSTVSHPEKVRRTDGKKDGRSGPVAPEHGGGNSIHDHDLAEVIGQIF